MQFPDPAVVNPAAHVKNLTILVQRNQEQIELFYFLNFNTE
jgi:hypothetical protein